MPTNPRKWRAVVMTVVALAVSGPASAGARAADDVAASPSDQSGSESVEVAAAAETAASAVDPATAKTGTVIGTLEQLRDAVQSRAESASAAAKAHDQAAAELAAATKAGARADARADASDRQAVTLFLSTRFNGGAIPALEPAEVVTARETLAKAEDAAADAASALSAAKTAEAEFAKATTARVRDLLVDADAIQKRDPRAARLLRAAAGRVSASLEGDDGDRGSAAAKPRSKPAAKPKPAARPKPQPKVAPEPPLPDPTGSASGALAGPWCPNGERIVVDASLGASVQALLNEAQRWGVSLCARSGFRPYAEQVALRAQNCGSSQFAIYQASPSSCSPPTARPGTSNHEDGLAIDFSCGDGQPMTHGSPCFQWLAAHARWYGLRNLPSEPWHWSVSGR
jgi:D-alanyl-D-alanine carboxypeptidase